MSKNIWMPVLFALVACLLLVPGAEAGLRFPPPQDLSGAGGVDPQVAVDPQDRAIVIWRREGEGRRGTIESVGISADGTPGAVQSLSDIGEPSDENIFAPQVAVDPLGNSTAVWNSFDRQEVEVVRIRADGTVGPVQTLADGIDPHVAVDSLGRATVAWFAPGLGPGLQSVRLGADGTPGAIQTLGEGLEPQVAVDSRDRVTVVWRTGGAPLRRVQAVRLGADGTPGRVRTLSKHAALDPQVAVDPKGRATVVWRRFAESKPNQRVEAVQLGRDGKPGKVRVLSQGTAPQVAVDRRGRATVVWVRAKRKKNTVRIQSARLGPKGSPGTVRVLSKPFATDPRVTVDSRGRATVVWAWGKRASRIDRVQARRLPRRGAPEPIRTLSEPGQHASDPQVAVDSQGRPTVVWTIGTAIQSTRGG